LSYHLYETEALIIDDRNNGEANKFFYLLAPALGLLTVKAQGVRLLKSKLRYQLKRYSLIRATLVRGREIWRITGAEKSREYDNIFRDQTKAKLAVRIFSLLRGYIQGEAVITDLFSDLLSAFDFLDNKEVDFSADHLAVWEIIVVLRILYHLGYIKGHDELASLVAVTDWSASALVLSEKKKLTAIAAINEALSSSHL